MTRQLLSEVMTNSGTGVGDGAAGTRANVTRVPYPISWRRNLHGQTL
jgi:hypothetical protein